MRTINHLAAQVAGRVKNDYSLLLTNMPRRFFCLTYEQESYVWQKVLDAYDRGTHDPYILSKIACDAVEDC